MSTNDMFDRDDTRLLRLTQQLAAVLRNSTVLAEHTQRVHEEADAAGRGPHPSHRLVERGAARVQRLRQAATFIDGAITVLSTLEGNQP
jgi:hypothetical protein